MRIIFLGTPEFAIPSLKKILASNHELIAIVSQPDKQNDRGNKTVFSPVKKFAIENNIPLYQFAKISRDGVEDLKALNPDIMITASYGQILSQQVIDIPKYGIINVHASLLPELRGASPIQTAIIRGEERTGITIMKTEAGLDTGDIILAKATPIGEDETAGELSARLAVIGADLLMEALEQIENGLATYTQQGHVDSDVTRRITKEQGKIMWAKSAKQIKCQILGQNPSPIAFSYLNGEPVKIYRAREAKEIKSSTKIVGTVLPESSAKTGLFVSCGQGAIEITELQFPGKKVMHGGDAINGRKIKVGDRFEELEATENVKPIEIKG